MKKLGLSAYENDSKPTDKKFAYIIDESIMVNREKLLLILGVPAEHPGRPLKHEDVTVVSMKSGGSFKGDDIKQEIEKSIKEIKAKPEYVISDQAHNLTNGISQSELLHHIDISHAMGTCFKHAYGNEPDFVDFTTLLGKVRLQYHLTDKAYLLPPNMRSIARFMNLNSWVDWGNKMLGCFGNLPKEMQDAYSFVPDYKELLVELKIAVDAVEYIETICKTEGFNLANCKKCKRYITQHVIGNANNRRAMFGIRVLEYLKQQEEKLKSSYEAHNISSDIIESTFGVFKQKKSPNKLYGITPFVLFIPLHAKLKNDTATKTFNFKERLCNVKLKDIDAFGNHSILRLDTHCSLTYLCSVIINDKDYGKRKSKLPGGVRPLSAVLRDQGPSGVLCGLWSELRQIHELAAPPAVEQKAGEDGSGGTAQGSQGADNRQAQQQSYREDGSETAGR